MNELSTNLIEFLPVVLIGFIVAAYKSLKHFIEKREELYEDCDEDCDVQKPRYSLIITSIFTDGIGGAIVGGIVYGLMSLTEYSYTIKICLAAVAGFIGVDKVMSSIESFFKNKFNITTKEESK